MTKPEDATVPTAVGTPLEPSVGRLPDEATNASGPRGTYGCACVSRNAFACAEIRDGYCEEQRRCECMCHNWEDDDEQDD